MAHFDWISLMTGLIGLGAGLTAFNAKVVSLAKKVEPLAQKVEHVYEHVKNSREVKTTVHELQLATTAETEVARQSSIKAATYCAVQAIGVDLANVSDIQKAAIAKFIKAYVPPKFKNEITPVEVDDVLKLIGQEIESAKQHDGIKAAKSFIEWLNSISDVPASSKVTISQNDASQQA